jgi:hypothetical protein
MPDYNDGRSWGLLKPFRRGATDFEAGTGAELNKTRVRNVVSTKAAGFQGRIGGEYFWRLGFGSWAHLLKHRAKRTYGDDLAVVYVGMALDRWVPQVIMDSELTELGVDSADDTSLRIRLYYYPADPLSDGTRTPSEPTSLEATL